MSHKVSAGHLAWHTGSTPHTSVPDFIPTINENVRYSHAFVPLETEPSILALFSLVGCIVRWVFFVVSTRPFNFPFPNQKF